MPDLGRSRSLRRAGSHKEIRQTRMLSHPQPVLMRTDATSQNDLSVPRSTKSPPNGMIPKPNGGFKMEQRPQPAVDTISRNRTRSKTMSKVSPSQNPSFSLPTQRPEIYYKADLLGDSNIGLALGSPTQAAMSNRPGSSVDSITSSPSMSSGAFSDQSAVKPKDRPGRWKALFGRRPSPPQPRAPFYQVQRIPTPLDFSASSGQRKHILVPKASSPLPGEERGPKPSTKEDYFRPKASKAAFPLSSERAPTVPSKGEQSPIPPPKDYSLRLGVPTVTVNGPDSESQTTNSKSKSKSKPSGLMLDIDIPESQMERYSIMFSQVLRPDDSSSLLFRRQNTNGGAFKPLDEFTLNTQSANRTSLKPTRRATSPSFKSPGFAVSLFPPHDPRTAAKSRIPSPPAESDPRKSLQRSRTEPIQATISPVPSEEIFTMYKAPSPSVPEKEPKIETGTGAEPLNSQNKPKFNEPTWEWIKREDGLTSPQSISPLTTLASKTDFPFNISVNPASQSAYIIDHREALKSNPLPLRKSSKPPGSSSQSSPKQAKGLPKSPKSSDGAPPKDRSRSKSGRTQVAIARQVSVSKTNTRINTAIGGKSGTPKEASPERLMERRGMTPMLVEVSNRRSHQVQIVDA